MVVDSKRSRGPLAALLLASAALLAIGTAIEGAGHSESVSTAPSEGEAGHSDSGESGGETGHVEGGGAEVNSTETHSEKETLLGVDIESPLFVTIGVLVSIALATAAVRSSKKAVFFVVVSFTLAFAVLDGKELVHQLDESRTGLAALRHIGHQTCQTRQVPPTPASSTKVGAPARSLQTMASIGLRHFRWLLPVRRRAVHPEWRKGFAHGSALAGRLWSSRGPKPL